MKKLLSAVGKVIFEPAFEVKHAKTMETELYKIISAGISTALKKLAEVC